jgi:RNA polymerase sigma-70 factor (ECF subfamily)
MLAAARTETGPSDRVLLVRFRQGDRSAFGVLYERYAPSLLFFAHSQVGDAALAEDLLQDCFLRILDLDPAQLHQDSLRGLLYTVLRNLARDEGRRKVARQKSYPLLGPSTIAGGEAARFDDLSLALHALPSEQREAVVLKNYADLSFAEIGEMAGVSESTVKSRYRYAIEKLAELLGEKS